MTHRFASCIALLFGLAVMARASDARAEDLVTIELGASADGAGDAVKQKALDKAFGDAVQRVLRKMLSKAARSRHRNLLRDEIERRARLYVESYKVLDERRIEGELRIQVAVKVDRDKIRDALSELKIDPDAGQGDGGGSRPRVVVLLKYSGGAETSTTFGSTGGDGGTAGRAFFAELRAQGFDVIEAKGARAPLGDDADGQLPLGDDAAIDLAKQLGAGGAFVVGLQADSEGRLRGTALFGAAGKASVRVLDANTGKAVAKASVAAAGFGDDESAALSNAATELAKKTVLGVAGKAARYWPPERTSTGGLQVRIRGARTWSAIADIIVKLGATKGIRGVHASRVDSGRVDLAIDTDLAARTIASRIKKARLRKGAVAVKIKDGRVLVKVSGDSRYTGAP